ncbi:HigA family addiction module antitoxin [Methylocystis sp. MJC1]|uniref:HigA family addiction module antitoxin n=1 Tax=Methylocystis sp. MJC1 TaxID=2654282 RepID=UPI0027D1F2BF|nr:HigA family addiction module antitoxin [Methylocystis sp. MJC1]
MEPIAGTYYEALTRLLLTGAFPEGDERSPPKRGASVNAVSAPARKATPIAAAPRHVAKAATPRAPLRRTTPQLSFQLAPAETEVTHPGRILAQHLFDLGLTASDLARDIGVPVNRVTAIINGQRGVTADTALRFGHWFGVDPEDWLDLQLQYELALARAELGAEIKGRPRLADRIA